MKKIIKIATFNVGCGVPYLLNRSNNTFDFVEYLIDLLNKEAIDVITLEESLMADDNNKSFGKMISECSELKYHVDFPLSPSHLIENRTMGVTILSKYPILKSECYWLENPNLTIVSDSGNTLFSHNKGFLLTEIEFENRVITYIGGHSFPFYLFKVDEHDYVNHYKIIDTLLSNQPEERPVLVAADFNTNYLEEFLLKASSKYHSVFNVPTRPTGQRHDYILFNDKCKLLTSNILKGQFDHYCCIGSFELR